MYTLASPDAKGSPPLARGTEAPRLMSSMAKRITPACAGNSDKARGRSPEGRDHPRLRGEQRQAPTNMPMCRGSPPLARGTASYTAFMVAKFRITPACAGNSSCGLIAPGRYKDHPRLRGEQTKKRLVVPCILQYRFSFFNQFFVDIFC